MIAVALAAVALAGPYEYEPFNGNHSAAGGTIAPWAADGWAPARYRDVGADHAINRFGSGAEDREWLFASGVPGATLTQVVPVETVEELFLSASISATGDRDAGAVVSAQPLDFVGAPIGPATAIGSPTARDRFGVPDMLMCAARLEAPEGTRAFTLTVTATAATDAQHLALVDDIKLAQGSIVTQVGSTRGFAQAEGAGCSRYAVAPGQSAEPVPPPPPPVFTPPTGVQVTKVRMTRRRVAFRLSVPTRVLIDVRRLSARRPRTVATDSDAAGRVAKRLKLRPGRYQLTVRSAATGETFLQTQRRVRR